MRDRQVPWHISGRRLAQIALMLYCISLPVGFLEGDYMMLSPMLVLFGTLVSLGGLVRGGIELSRGMGRTGLVWSAAALAGGALFVLWFMP